MIIAAVLRAIGPLLKRLFGGKEEGGGNGESSAPAAGEATKSTAPGEASKGSSGLGGSGLGSRLDARRAARDERRAAQDARRGRRGL